MKIFAIGMNYAAHNKELHDTLKRPDEPVIFTKADSAILNQGKPFFIPDHLGRIDYETEVVVRICRLGKNIPERFAHRYYDALTVGIDFTARDLQKRASEAGQPWTICKGFDGSAAIGEWEPKEKFLDIQAVHFHLDINGKTVQEGCTSDMLYRVDEIIAYINRCAQEKALQGAKVGVIATAETYLRYQADDVVNIGARTDEEAIAAHLYAALRDFDEAGVTYIYSEEFDTPRIGQAIMNRLIRAAGHQMIEV